MRYSNDFFWSRNALGDGHNFTWFVVLYFIAAYIRLYGLPFKRKTYISGYFMISLGLAVSRVGIGAVTSAVLGEENRAGLFYAYNSLPVLISSICFFCWFESLNLKDGRFSENCIFWGGLSFGVFLLHHHFIIREHIWGYIDVPKMLGYGIMPTVVYMFLVVILIFIAGCLVEKIRLLILEKIKLRRFLGKCDSGLETLLKKYHQ